MIGNVLKLLRKSLFPIKWLYALVVGVRNILFNTGVLDSKSYDLPIIAVGNITAGGTGKTPHVEYLIRLLHKKHKLTVLSRGYNRKSKGLVIADEKSDAISLGDEPFQIYTKFKDTIELTVDANRRRALDVISDTFSDINLVILDDAFQHRYVKPGLSILLVDYNRPIYSDRLLPVGNLREPVSEKRRAHLIVVTKCPVDLTPLEARVIRNKLAPAPYQNLYFSSFEYQGLSPLIEGGDVKELDKLTAACLLTAIASPKPLIKYLKAYNIALEQLSFNDHHYFTKKDWSNVMRNFKLLEGDDKIIITTEKDAARMRSDVNLPEELKPFIYIIPLKVKLLMDGEASFNTKILSYVEKNI